MIAYCDHGVAPASTLFMCGEAEDLFPDKRIRIAHNWVWHDIVCGDEVSSYLSAEKTHDEDWMDEKRLYQSTLLVQFSCNCIFSTLNSSYILIGPGRREVKLIGAEEGSNEDG